MSSEYLRRIDALVAEHVMHWVRVQPPKWDYDGPLPEQGEVLVPFSMVDAITAGQFAWPPKGIIPFDWMVPRFSSDVAAAWQVVEKFKERKLYMSVECVGDTGYHAVVYDEDGNHLTDAYSEKGPAHAVCVAALRAVGVEVPVDALTA